MAAEVAAETGSLRSADGTRLSWRIWPRTGSSVLLAVVHGLGEHGGRYAGLARAMAERGVATAALDLRGMGASEGRRGHVDRWQRWVDDCAAFIVAASGQAGAAEVVPLGHSFGGVVLTSAVVRGAIAPARFVLSNPAFRLAVRVPAWKLRLGRLASGAIPTLALNNEVDPELLSRDPDAVRRYREDPLVHDRITSRLFTEWWAASREALEESDRIAAPFLLLVSEDDRIVDPAGAEELARRVRVDHQVKRYPGRFHEPFHDLGADEVFGDLATWLTGG